MAAVKWMTSGGILDFFFSVEAKKSTAQLHMG